MSMEKECARWKLLDSIYGTDKRSPLHHDNRCELCRETSPSRG